MTCRPLKAPFTASRQCRYVSSIPLFVKLSTVHRWISSPLSVNSKYTQPSTRRQHTASPNLISFVCKLKIHTAMASRKHSALLSHFCSVCELKMHISINKNSARCILEFGTVRRRFQHARIHQPECSTMHCCNGTVRCRAQDARIHRLVRSTFYGDPTEQQSVLPAGDPTEQ